MQLCRCKKFAMNPYFQKGSYPKITKTLHSDGAPCSLALGARPIEEFLPQNRTSNAYNLKFYRDPWRFQGRIHKQVSLEISNKGLCTLATPLTVHLLWKMAATIWRTQNQALHDTKYKTQLDLKIQHILMYLQENSIAHRPFPLGYSFMTDSKQAWIRWETLPLKTTKSPYWTGWSHPMHLAQLIWEELHNAPDYGWPQIPQRINCQARSLA